MSAAWFHAPEHLGRYDPIWRPATAADQVPSSSSFSGPIRPVPHTRPAPEIHLQPTPLSSSSSSSSSSSPAMMARGYGPSVAALPSVPALLQPLPPSLPPPSPAVAVPAFPPSFPLYTFSPSFQPSPGSPSTSSSPASSPPRAVPKPFFQSSVASPVAVLRSSVTPTTPQASPKGTCLQPSAAPSSASSPPFPSTTSSSTATRHSLLSRQEEEQEENVDSNERKKRKAGHDLSRLLNETTEEEDNEHNELRQLALLAGTSGTPSSSFSSSASSSFSASSASSASSSTSEASSKRKPSKAKYTAELSSGRKKLKRAGKHQATTERKPLNKSEANKRRQNHDDDEEYNDESYLSDGIDRPSKTRKKGGKEKAVDDKQKRRKPNTACTSCRKSHFKCDGKTPCSRCVQKGRPHECQLPVASMQKIKLLEEETARVKEQNKHYAQELKLKDYELRLFTYWWHVANTEFMPLFMTLSSTWMYVGDGGVQLQYNSELAQALEKLPSLVYECIVALSPLTGADRQKDVLSQLQLCEDTFLRSIYSSSSSPNLHLRGLYLCTAYVLYRHLAANFWNAELEEPAIYYARKIQTLNEDAESDRYSSFKKDATNVANSVLSYFEEQRLLRTAAASRSRSSSEGDLQCLSSGSSGEEPETTGTPMSSIRDQRSRSDPSSEVRGHRRSLDVLLQRPNSFSH
ncbi:hypothetical protein QOT17_008502 [Balamuthia mandrillaris]